MNQLKEMLEAYRNGERGLPTYDELQILVEVGEPPETIHCREFHELAMDYRAAAPFVAASKAYDAMVSFIDGRAK